MNGKENSILARLVDILCENIQSAEDLLKDESKKSFLDQASLEKTEADQNEIKRVQGELTEKFPRALNEICNKMNEMTIAVEKSQNDLVLLESKEKEEQQKIKNRVIAQETLNRKLALQNIFSDKRSQWLKEQEENSLVKPDHKNNISVLDEAQQSINQQLETCRDLIDKEKKIISEIFKWFTVEKTINIQGLAELSDLMQNLNTPITDGSKPYDLDTIHTVILLLIALSDIYLNHIKQQIKNFEKTYLSAIHNIKDNFGQVFNDEQHRDNKKINCGLSEIIELIKNANDSCRKLLSVFCILDELIYCVSDLEFSRDFIKAWDDNIISFRIKEFQDFQKSVNSLSNQLQEFFDNKKTALKAGKIPAAKHKTLKQKDKEKSALKNLPVVQEQSHQLKTLVEKIASRLEQQANGTWEDQVRQKVLSQAINAFKSQSPGHSRYPISQGELNKNRQGIRITQSYSNLLEKSLAPGSQGRRVRSMSCPNLINNEYFLFDARQG